VCSSSIVINPVNSKGSSHWLEITLPIPWSFILQFNKSMKTKTFIFITGFLLGVSQSTFAIEYADKLLGAWEGQQTGFSGNQYQENQAFRLTFEQAKGYAALGSKQWRNAKGEWSAPEPVQAILQKNNTFSAVDSDGYMNGKLTSRNQLSFVYLEANSADPLDDSSALLVTLKRIGK
jgi:hypothetical protein